MDSDQQAINDWVNLPEGAATLSLWHTLHDGNLMAIKSDLLARTVTLRFDADYVRDFHHLPEQTRFVIKVIGVRSVRSLVNVPWPGEFCVPRGVAREEESRLIAEYHSKWRQESGRWSDFERTADGLLLVSDATLARGSDALALHIGVLVENKSYVDAYIHGDGIVFCVGENQVTPDEFVALGEAYWDALA
ncbi:MAG: hypothetical protein ACLQGV_19385 [Bryobacteraceae bacterium]